MIGLMLVFLQIYLSFSTRWVKIVWLMGNLYKLSSCLTNLRHMGHLTLRFLDISKDLHVKLSEAGGTECVSAMNHDSGYSEENIVILFTKLALILIDEFINKVLNLGGGFFGDGFGLFEEEGRWIFECFHLLINLVEEGDCWVWINDF